MFETNADSVISTTKTSTGSEPAYYIYDASTVYINDFNTYTSTDFPAELDCRTKSELIIRGKDMTIDNHNMGSSKQRIYSTKWMSKTMLDMYGTLTMDVIAKDIFMSNQNSDMFIRLISGKSTITVRDAVSVFLGSYNSKQMIVYSDLDINFMNNKRVKVFTIGNASLCSVISSKADGKIKINKLYHSLLFVTHGGIFTFAYSNTATSRIIELTNTVKNASPVIFADNNALISLPVELHMDGLPHDASPIVMALHNSKITIDSSANNNSVISGGDTVVSAQTGSSIVLDKVKIKARNAGSYDLNAIKGGTIRLVNKLNSPSANPTSVQTSGSNMGSYVSVS
jgi:hypothetical protein